MVSSFFFFSSPNLSRHRLDACHTSTHGGLSANLRCRSETYGMGLAENTGRKKVTENRHLCTIAQLCRAISSQLRHVEILSAAAQLYEKSHLTRRIALSCGIKISPVGSLD